MWYSGVMEDTLKSHKKSYDWLKPYQFGPGNNANPNGRPKGKTLKEFAREYLQSLPDDRKIEYLATLPEEIVWKMAEGNPQTDVTSGGEKIIPVPIYGGESKKIQDNQHDSNKENLQSTKED